MTFLTRCSSFIQLVFPVLGGVLLGGFLGFASAQDGTPGQLDTACASLCTANGYDAEFCGQVCWVPDPQYAAKGDGVDWKCMTGCRERGGRAEDCMVSCQRR
jgi:hypothetical protein